MLDVDILKSNGGISMRHTLSFAIIFFLACFTACDNATEVETVYVFAGVYDFEYVDEVTSCTYAGPIKVTYRSDDKNAGVKWTDLEADPFYEFFDCLYYTNPYHLYSALVESFNTLDSWAEDIVSRELQIEL
jgi:hypothetical protein